MNEGGAKSLSQLYFSHKWFKDLVDRENNLLLQAIQSNRQTKTDSLIKEFFKVRNERRAHISASDFDFGQLEKSFETLEGSARFIEAFVLSHPIKDRYLASIDNQFSKTGNLTSKELEYIYDTKVSGSYFYATGYNILRLLKKLKVDYEALLFKQPSLTLEDILRQQYYKRFKQKNS